MRAALIKAPTWKGVQQITQLAIMERQNFHDGTTSDAEITHA